MTMPSGSDPSGFTTTALPGTILGAGLSALVGRSQSAVTTQYKGQVQTNSTWTGLSNSFFAGLNPNGITQFPLLLMQAFASAIGIPPGAFTSVTNIFTGISTWFTNLGNIFGGGVNLHSTSFDPVAAATTFINDVLLPTNLFANWTQLYQQLTGSAGGTLADLGSWLLTGVLGPISAGRIPLIPVAHIGNTNPNLLLNGSFQQAISLVTGGAWTWDGTVGQTTLGSAKVAANSTLQALNSNLIDVVPGQTFTISGAVQWAGAVMAGGGSAFQLNVQPVNNGSVLGTTNIAQINSPAASGSWTPLTGSYTVPAGVTQIAVQVAASSAVTAGNAWFDDLSAVKTGLMSNSFMKGLTGGNTIGQDFQAMVDNAINGVQGGSTTGNSVATVLSVFKGFFTGTGTFPTLLSNLFGSPSVGSVLHPAAVPDVTLGMSTDLQTSLDNIVQALNGWGGSGYSHPNATAAMSNLTGSVSTTAARLDAYIQSQSAKPSTMDNFSRVLAGPSGLATNWSQTRSNTNAHWECNNNAVPVVDNNGSCDMFNRWVGTWQPTVDYMKSSTTLATAPQRGWPATNFQGRNFVFCRADSALSNMVWVDWNITGAWFLYKRIGGTDTAMASGTTSSPPTAGSVMTLEAGQSGTSTTRMYRVTLNNVVVQDWSACGDTTSNVGATFRFCGFGGHGDGSATMMLPGQVHTWVGAEI